jgi:predicted PolB exonuclease-like 3'-5' exonuclease
VTPILAFDIETIPDCQGLIEVLGLAADTPHTHVAEIAFQQRRKLTGSDFLQPYVHRVTAISCALRDRDGFRVWSLGSADEDEARLIQRFFDGLARYTPQLVSWNGSGFDLPVLAQRALIHGLSAPRFWDQGEDDRDFKWNNYLSRYHTRHLDLMDMLALWQPRGAAPLDEMARLCGFPGKLGMDGSQVWSAWLAGRLPEIRAYCETDATNTYLLFLRFQRLRGQLTADAYADEVALVRRTLADSPEPHWKEFLAAWPTPALAAKE